MLTLRDEYWISIANEIQSIFREIFFDGFFRIANTPLERFNADAYDEDPSLYLSHAMKAGRVSWRNGVYYSRRLDARLSGELHKIARWDKKRRQFTGDLPDWLKPMHVEAESKRSKQILSMTEELQRVASLSDDALGKMVDQAVTRISAGRMHYLIDRDIEKSLKSFGISIDISQDMKEAMRVNYLENQA